MSSDSLFKFKVNFKKDTFEFDYLPLLTVQEVKLQCQELTGIEISYQKLLFKGILRNEVTLKDSGILPGSKLILIATAIEDIKALRITEDKVKHRQQLKPTNVYKSLNKKSKYTFNNLKVLPEFHSQDKALQFLEKLKNDPGITGIMEKHRWEVGELIELSPSEKTILGYNRNKGQTIALRLRTDDLTGFIHYPTVRKVLLHELAHMVFSEHDSQFHKLNRELNKEVIDLDWTQRGNKLSINKFHTDNSTTTNKSTAGYRLGGKKLDSNLFNASPQYRRSAISEAVDLRLSKEEIELEQGCQTQLSPENS